MRDTAPGGPDPRSRLTARLPGRRGLRHRRASRSPETPRRRGRVPVPAGRQQGLAQVRTQLPQRGLLFWHLQRPRPLLKPHSQLHGSGGGAQGLGPRGSGGDDGAAGQLLLQAAAAALERRLPELRVKGVGAVLRGNGERAPRRRPSCRPVSGTRAPSAAHLASTADGLRSGRRLWDLRSMTRRSTAPPESARSPPRRRRGCRGATVSRLVSRRGCATLKREMQTTHPAAPRGPAVPGSYLISSAAPSSSGVCSKEP